MFKRLYNKIQYRFLYFRKVSTPEFIGRNKEHGILKFFENATWFKWYGKSVIYVKPKKDEDLSVTERAVREAINAKDYIKAMSIVEELPDSPKTVALKQVIQAKL